jgi:hypothetical protein
MLLVDSVCLALLQTLGDKWSKFQAKHLSLGFCFVMSL